MFLISTKTEEQVVASYGWGATLKPIGSWACALGAAFLLIGAMREGAAQVDDSVVTSWIVL